MLADNGYVIKSLNTVDFEQSMHYNPFAYIHSQEDILVLVDLVIKNCGGKDQKEDFWVQAERLLYNAVFGYVYYVLDEEQKNFESVVKIITQMKVNEENESYFNAVDILFEELEAEQPNNFAVANYKQYKLAAGKTAKSILISCAIRLQAFNAEKIKEITRDDEMHLDQIGTTKTALFLIIDDTSSTYNFLVAMMYTQLFKELCHKASELGGRLPVHVRCLLDEFANIGKIPDFEQLIATIRSREISACVILQSFSQIKGLYEKQAGTIIGNCDTFLFLGSSDLETCKEVSEKIGKTTIDHKGSSTQKGMNGSFTVQEQIIGRELITPAEVSLLKKNECIVQIRCIKPFRSIKYDIKKHKNYKQLSDYNRKNTFDIVAYNKHINQSDELEFDDEIQK
jgi:type IV secretion system protein VirD4